jgi:hypothetical protein
MKTFLEREHCETNEYDDYSRACVQELQSCSKRLFLVDHVETVKPSSSLEVSPAAGKNTAFYPLPTWRGYLRDRNGRYIPSREIRTLRTALSENELRDYLQRRNDWSNETYNSINWSAYSSASAGLTDNARTTGCPSEYAKDNAAPRLISTGTATKS